MSALVRRVAAGVVAAAGVSLGLTGCSGAGDTTCDEWSAMSIGDRIDELTALLRSHDLEPNDPGNVAGVTQAVTSYCSPSSLGGGTAGQNGDQPLDNAADWESETW